MKNRVEMISNVKQIATGKGLNPYDLADLANTTPQTVYGLWTGNIYTKWIGTFVQIAKALDCQVEDLFTVSEVNGAN